MNYMDNFMQLPEDSVPCKIRAKRGCATHPRSIAERERRTRISGKLKKLQDLVPNMDKQTSYSDMLDLAVQHIKAGVKEYKLTYYTPEYETKDFTMTAILERRESESLWGRFCNWITSTENRL
jgi:hypothetical protein